MRKILLLLLLIITYNASAQLAVMYKCPEHRSNTPIIKLHIKIINLDSKNIPLNEIKVHYFYEKEGNAEEFFQVDYALIGSSQVNVEFFYGYAEISFPDNEMVIPPGGNSGEIHIRFSKQDWSNYNQDNDFSFNPEINQYTAHEGIAIYYKEELVWGNEYLPEPSPVPRKEK